MGEVLNEEIRFGRQSVGVGTDTVSGVQRRTIWMNDGIFDPSTLFTGGFLGGFYDVSDKSTLFQDSAGITPVTASGQPVGRVSDKSGNGNHLIQATAGARPLWNFTNGISSLVFDGIDDKLEFPINMLIGWTSGTGLFNAKIPVDPPGANNGPTLGFFANGGAPDAYPNTLGNVNCSFLTNANQVCGDPGNMAAWHTADFRSQTNDFRAGFNAVDYFTTGVNTVAITTGVAGFPCLGQSGYGGFYTGNIGTVYVINRVLGASDLSKLRTFAGARIGLAL